LAEVSLFYAESFLVTQLVSPDFRLISEPFWWSLVPQEGEFALPASGSAAGLPRSNPGTGESMNDLSVFRITEGCSE